MHVGRGGGGVLAVVSMMEYVSISLLYTLKLVNSPTVHAYIYLYYYAYSWKYVARFPLAHLVNIFSVSCLYIVKIYVCLEFLFHFFLILEVKCLYCPHFSYVPLPNGIAEAHCCAYSVTDYEGFQYFTDT